ALPIFRQNPRTGGLSDATRPTEQKRLCKLVVFNGVFKGNGDMLLPHHRVKGGGPVFTGRNNKIIHRYEDRDFARNYLLDFIAFTIFTSSPFTNCAYSSVSRP